MAVISPYSSLSSQLEGIQTKVQQVWKTLKEGKNLSTILKESSQDPGSSQETTIERFKKTVNSLVNQAAFYTTCTCTSYIPVNTDPDLKKIRYVDVPCADEVLETWKIQLSPFTIRRLLLQTIDEVVAEKEKFVTNEKDFSRLGKLPLPELLWFVMSLGKNTNNQEVFEFCRRKKLPTVTQQAVYYARQKILPEIFQELMERFFEKIKPYLPKGKYTVYLIDGSEFRYPFNPKEPEAGIKAKGDIYHGHIQMTGLLHAASGMFAAVRLSQGAKKEEANSLIHILESGKLSARDLVLGDRLYCSYKVLAAFKESGVQFLIRSKDVDSPTSMFRNKGLPKGECDTDVTFHLSYRQTNELKRDKDYKHISKDKFPYFKEGEEVYELKLRLIRYKRNGEYHTLVTSIPREEMSMEEIIRLYGCRWEIETTFRYLKSVCKIEYFHSKSMRLNVQELLARLALYNGAKAITLCQPKVKKGKHIRKVGFSNVYQTIVAYLFDEETEEDLLEKMKVSMEIEKKNRHNPRKMRIRMIPSYNHR